jgi:hypothetical protein
MNPRTKKTRYGFVGLAVLLFALCGCSVDRMLGFKEQLKNPEANVRMTSDASGDTYTFVNPILKDEDFDGLGLVPSEIVEIDRETSDWVYAFKKKADEKYGFSIRMRLKKNALESIHIDARLSRLLRKDVTTEVMRCLGTSKIEILKRQLKFDADTARRLGLIQFPKQKMVQDYFGDADVTKPYQDIFWLEVRDFETTGTPKMGLRVQTVFTKGFGAFKACEFRGFGFLVSFNEEDLFIKQGN